MKPTIVAFTGASGVVYGIRLVKALLEANRPVALIISEPARLVIREELGISLKSYTNKEEFLSLLSSPGLSRRDYPDPNEIDNSVLIKGMTGGSIDRSMDPRFRGDDKGANLLTTYSPKDFAAPVASGSYPTEGMIIVPCSMGTLGAIASGISQNLIHRAADCALKEGRKLVLVPRETPLSAIHLENMLKLAKLGVRIVPAMPAFYSGAQNLNEMIDFMVGKVLDQMEIPHALYPRWTGILSKDSSCHPEGRRPEGSRDPSLRSG